MKLEEIDTDVHVKLGLRVYKAEDLYKLFDVRGIPFETIEEDITE